MEEKIQISRRLVRILAENFCEDELNCLIDDQDFLSISQMALKMKKMMTGFEKSESPKITV